MKAKDVMTPRVITVAPDDTILHAVRLMLQNRISGLPVIKAGGDLVGIITEGDLLRRMETQTARRRPRWLEFLTDTGKLAEEYTRAHGRKVSEVMTPHPVTIDEETALDEIVRIMEKRRIKRLPVMRGNQLAGIVSRANLLHALASVAKETKVTSAGDAAIRDKLLAELGKQPWAPIGLINIVVRDGVVELWGAITDERERYPLIVAAENIPGVKGVRDHLAWIDPASGTVLEPADQAPSAH